ncbi:hypothetical protein [Telluribacter sp. SYSU D00476]|uniref:hypothetical protein n=1 Tax=Telluribacter sp. SYSU D00476 TaxID=2811430 RepID=UPI001FF6335D|nr:hypothetical protein [Telluribacter sp. SYSU D00476]
MTEQHEQLAALREIRTIMDRSSRFISLSGLSGIGAGLSALVGVAAIQWHLSSRGLTYQNLYNDPVKQETGLFLAAVAVVVLILAISTAVYFTTRNAHKVKQSVWNSQAQRVVVNLSIPLAAGGVFCLVLLYHQYYSLIAPSMLVFYGLGLINCGKYTYRDIRSLGFCELALGLLACFIVDYGFLAWALGFGVLHLVYGAVMYYKYERSPQQVLN